MATEPTQQEDVIGLDFDKTLAEHDSSIPYDHRELGAPLPDMVERVKQEMAQGVKFVIFTARVNPGITYDNARMATESYLLIADWCAEHLGQVIPITYVKTPEMKEIWDDRARQVQENTGRFVNEPDGFRSEPGQVQ